MTMQLFRVRTIAKELDGFKNVPIVWAYLGKRTPARPYAELIKGYATPTPGVAIAYAEEAIDEMFSADEAAQLIAYLRVESVIKPVKLPIANNSIGLDALHDGGSFALYERHAYSLSFRVAGYFDFHGCERINPDVDEFWVGP
jgi:hypothetical protein